MTAPFVLEQEAQSLGDIMIELKTKIEVYAKKYKDYHLYGADGKTFPSVTAILKILGTKTTPLMIWARKEALKLAKQELRNYMQTGQPLSEIVLEQIIDKADRYPDKVKDEAGDIGSKIHKAIDDYIVGNPPELDEQSKIGFDNFLSWVSKEEIRLIKGDTPVVSIKHEYGGSLDAIGLQGKKLILFDWKTGNAIYDEYCLQVAAYAQAFKETYGRKIDKAIIVRFGKDTPDVEPQEVDINISLKAFNAALSLYKIMKMKDKFRVVKNEEQKSILH